MNTKSTLWLIVCTLVVGPAALAADKSGRACCAKVPALAATNYTDKSLYQVESKWTTDAGAAITLATLKGKPQVVAMFFANCTYACPLIVNDMKQIEAALPANWRTNVGFALVSFDTQRDTVAALAEYRRTRALPAERWTLLRGEAEDVRELAALLGVRYRQDATGQFSHSNIITVLDAEGEIVYQQVGLNQDVRETVHRLEKLIAP